MRRLFLAWSSLVAVSVAVACSSSSEDRSNETDPAGGSTTSSTGGAATGASPPPSGKGGVSGIDVPVGSGTSTPGVTEPCAAQTAEAKRRPVFLAFAFDVSGSMGKLDYAWHDPALKWAPVVAATESFFADTNSVGISASLTFFPEQSSKCSATTYGTPAVPMTVLPSTKFADAIAAITPTSSDDWRGGTPTLAVVEGVFTQLTPVVTDNPSASVAVVLVTDGYPQGCDDNDIGLVQAAVAAHPTIPTYVIGVENPPISGAPDTVSNLDGIAQSGKTNKAFLIETGDPTATSQQFADVIESIRGASISCDLNMPAPPTGETLDTRQINVTYRSGATSTPFVYDPTCATEKAWHLDNAITPTTVVLCPNDCTTVMADPNAKVIIEFGCEQRTPILQ